MNNHFWRGKKVFITGHTGFKGSWLSLWLQMSGAEVYGYSLPPSTDPNLFELFGINKKINSQFGDIRNFNSLKESIVQSSPDILFHMAAQAIVNDSYLNPVETYDTNVMGTVNVLEAIRHSKTLKAAVIITSDKCYENKEWLWGYRENEPLGGYDPYSSSKACAEIITSAYRNSFFNSNEYGKHGLAIATARAGNVIGGGDWAQHRLIPDIVRSIMANKDILIRRPNAIRPWQHVLEPLHGYMELAAKLFNQKLFFADSWNFGPLDSNVRTVESILNAFMNTWGEDIKYRTQESKSAVHEAHYLKLDSSKARTLLEWYPQWDIKETIQKTALWYKAFFNHEDMFLYSIREIEQYQNLLKP
jgi:CDP-glucose 4,6-dehydratase